MNRKLFRKTFLFIFFIIFLFVGNVLADDGSLGDESWTVEKKSGRMFYFTHGTIVWGHEFGFYKMGNCESDIVWLTFSARDERVKDFKGQNVVVSLEVDGKDFRSELSMLYVGTIGYTHVMYLSSWVVGEQEMYALMKGRYVKVKILEPKELEALLDIKEDQFSLEGLAASRKEAESVCRTNASHKGKDLALWIPGGG